jgi:hypothetical protein
MRRILLPVVLLAVVFGTVAPAGAGDVATYVVDLDGASEVPGPGDPDGSGEVTLQLGTVSNEVCVTEFSTVGVEPTAAHIHDGGPGVAGPVVVDLTGSLSEVPFCTTVSADLMAELITRPECYYVNVHTAEFPDGAIRGQLVDGTCDDEPTTTTTTGAVSTSTTTGATGTAAAGASPRFTG